MCSPVRSRFARAATTPSDVSILGHDRRPETSLRPARAAVAAPTAMIPVRPECVRPSQHRHRLPAGDDQPLVVTFGKAIEGSRQTIGVGRRLNLQRRHRNARWRLPARRRRMSGRRTQRPGHDRHLARQRAVRKLRPGPRRPEVGHHPLRHALHTGDRLGDRERFDLPQQAFAIRRRHHAHETDGITLRPPRWRQVASCSLRPSPAGTPAPVTPPARSPGRRAAATSDQAGSGATRVSIARAPCPGDGTNASTGRYSVMRSCHPIRVKPGRGQDHGVVVRRSPPSGAGYRCCRAGRQWSRRAGAPAPAPRAAATRCRSPAMAEGRPAPRRAARPPRRAGLPAAGRRRSPARPARSSARPWCECTARSIDLASSASCSADANTPRPPIASSEEVLSRSPSGLMIPSSDDTPGCAAAIRSRTVLACQRARALPRVPMIRGGRSRRFGTGEVGSGA